MAASCDRCSADIFPRVRTREAGAVCLTCVSHRPGCVRTTGIGDPMCQACRDAWAPVVNYASSETAYGRTVPASFAIKVF